MIRWIRTWLWRRKMRTKWKNMRYLNEIKPGQIPLVAQIEEGLKNGSIRKLRDHEIPDWVLNYPTDSPELDTALELWDEKMSQIPHDRPCSWCEKTGEPLIHIAEGWLHLCKICFNLYLENERGLRKES